MDWKGIPCFPSEKWVIDRFSTLLTPLKPWKIWVIFLKNFNFVLKELSENVLHCIPLSLCIRKANNWVKDLTIYLSTDSSVVFILTSIRAYFRGLNSRCIKIFASLLFLVWLWVNSLVGFPFFALFPTFRICETFVQNSAKQSTVCLHHSLHSWSQCISYIALSVV